MRDSPHRPQAKTTRPKVALVHDWLVAQRGGENVLLHLAAMFEDAPIYTLVHRPGAVDARLETHPIVTSFVQTLPYAPHKFRQYLPLFPRAIAAFDLSAYDLIISTSHCVAHGVRTHPHQRHISYVHTPMRYLYDQMPAYLPAWGRRLTVPLATLASWPLRAWDVRHAQTPDTLVANSQYVARRIARVWGRDADVVYPPVDVGFFAAAPKVRRRGLLYVGALVPYKRADCAIGLARACDMPLDIIGEGPQRARLEAMAGPQVRFLRGVNRAGLRAAYAKAEALVFAGEEDFGIVPVEAMAAGCPVLALNRGGLAETVRDARGTEGATGVLFEAPTLEAMQPALKRLVACAKAGAFDGPRLAHLASCFDAAAFRRGMTAVIARTMGAQAAPNDLA